MSFPLMCFLFKTSRKEAWMQSELHLWLSFDLASMLLSLGFLIRTYLPKGFLTVPKVAGTGDNYDSNMINYEEKSFCEKCIHIYRFYTNCSWTIIKISHSVFSVHIMK